MINAGNKGKASAFRLDARDVANLKKGGLTDTEARFIQPTADFNVRRSKQIQQQASTIVGGPPAPESVEISEEDYDIAQRAVDKANQIIIAYNAGLPTSFAKLTPEESAILAKYGIPNPEVEIAKQQATVAAEELKFDQEVQRMKDEMRNLGYGATTVSIDAEGNRTYNFKPLAGRPQFEYFTPDPTNPFNIQKRQISGPTKDGQPDKVKTVQPTGDLLTDFITGVRVEGQNLLNDLNSMGQIAATSFANVPNYFGTIMGDPFAKARTGETLYKIGRTTIETEERAGPAVERDVTKLTVGAAAEFLTTGQTTVTAEDYAKVGQNIAASPAYAAGNIAVSAAQWLGPTAGLKLARAAHGLELALTSSKRAAQLAQSGAKAVGEEVTVARPVKFTTPRGDTIPQRELPFGFVAEQRQIPSFKIGPTQGIRIPGTHVGIRLPFVMPKLVVTKKTLEKVLLPKFYTLETKEGREIGLANIRRDKTKFYTEPLDVTQESSLVGQKIKVRPDPDRPLRVEDRPSKPYEPTAEATTDVVKTTFPEAEQIGYTIRVGAGKVSRKPVVYGPEDALESLQGPKQPGAAEMLRGIGTPKEQPLGTVVTFSGKELRRVNENIAKRQAQIARANEAIDEVYAKTPYKPMKFTQPKQEPTKATSKTPLETIKDYEFDISLQKQAAVAEFLAEEQAAALAAKAQAATAAKAGAAIGASSTLASISPERAFAEENDDAKKEKEKEKMLPEIIKERQLEKIEITQKAILKTKEEQEEKKKHGRPPVITLRDMPDTGRKEKEKKTKPFSITIEKTPAEQVGKIMSSAPGVVTGLGLGGKTGYEQIQAKRQKQIESETVYLRQPPGYEIDVKAKQLTREHITDAFKINTGDRQQPKYDPFESLRQRFQDTYGVSVRSDSKVDTLSIFNLKQTPLTGKKTTPTVTTKPITTTIPTPVTDVPTIPKITLKVPPFGKGGLLGSGINLRLGEDDGPTKIKKLPTYNPAIPGLSIGTKHDLSPEKALRILKGDTGKDKKKKKDDFTFNLGKAPKLNLNLGGNKKGKKKGKKSKK